MHRQWLGRRCRPARPPNPRGDPPSPPPAKARRRCAAPNACAKCVRFASTTCGGTRSCVHRVPLTTCLRLHRRPKLGRARHRLRIRPVGTAGGPSAPILHLMSLRRRRQLTMRLRNLGKLSAPFRARMSCSMMRRTQRMSPPLWTMAWPNRRNAERLSEALPL
jgi:hypothetical protein